jgi:hypothetical protein
VTTKYARAGGGAWATDATWSTSSGGAADTTAPGASDDAIIDTASGAVTSVTGTVLSLTITNTTSKTTAVTFSGTLTCTVSFSVTGNSAINRIICKSNSIGIARTISAAAVTAVNVDFRGITAAGAGSWSGTSVGDAGGNTGITFTTPVTRYGVVAGNWSSTATWSATSGGAGGSSVPLCQDTAVLNGSSAVGTYTIDMPRIGPIDAGTGFTRTLAVGLGAEAHGSITLNPGMTLSIANPINFYASATLTTNGLTWINGTDVFFGTLTLGSDWTTSYDGRFLGMSSPGAFNDGGFNVTASGASANLNMFAGGTITGSGTWTISSTTATTPWNFSGTAAMSTATIRLTGNTATDRTFAGAGKTYGALVDTNTSTGKLTITGANTFGSITKTAGSACTLALPTSSGITVTGSFAVTGAVGKVLTLTGDVTKASGTVSCDYMSISSSDAAGGATFYAGANSTDGGSNTGWIFTAPPSTGSTGDSAGRSLNRLAGTSGLDAQGAANVWAGTVGLDLVGALNRKAGVWGMEYNGVCRLLASQLSGNAELDAQGALASIP